MTTLQCSILRDVVAESGLSQAELARRANLSRTTVSALMRATDDTARVHAKTLRSLCRVLGVSPDALLAGSEVATASATEDYLAYLERRHGTLRMNGLAIPVPTTELSMKRLYVEPLVRPIEQATCDQSELPLPMYLHASRARHVTIRGATGSGKSTLLGQLALEHAEEARKGLAAVPLLVQSADVTYAHEHSISLDQAIAALARDEASPDIAELLATALEDKRGLILVDGLDELADEAHRRLVRRFLAEHPEPRVILSSRECGLDAWCSAEMGYEQLGICPWMDAQRDELALRWYATRHDHDAEQDCVVCEQLATALQAAIRADEQLLELATNPLTLLMIATLHGARGGHLPRRRVELYQRIVECHLLSWEASKTGPQPGGPLFGVQLDGRELGWLLSSIAYKMHDSGREPAPQWWLTDLLARQLQALLGYAEDDARRDAPRVIRYLIERSGLLIEARDEMVAFAHRSLQEYLAARGLAERDEPMLSLLGSRLFDPRWSHVVRMATAQLRPADTSAIVYALLADTERAGRHLQRGPLLALQCLADGSVLPDGRLLDELFGPLGDLGCSRWLGTTMRILDALKSLEGTRLAGRAREARAAILDNARRSLTPREALTLHLHGAGPRFLDRFYREWRAVDILDDIGELREVELDGMRIALPVVADADRQATPEKWRKCAIGALDASLPEEAQVALIEALAEDRVDDFVPHLHAFAREGGDVTAPLCVSLLLEHEVMDDGAYPDFEMSAAGAPLVVQRARQLAEDEAKLAMVEILASEAHVEVRCQAARELARYAADSTIAQVLTGHLTRDDETTWVRVASAHALLETVSGDSPSYLMLLELLERDDTDRLLRRVSAQTLAQALASRQLSWDDALVDRVEEVLLAIEDPCPCAWSALSRLVDFRFADPRREVTRLLSEALADIDGVRFAFLFGSFARNTQVAASDVDVLVVGDASLRALSGRVRPIESKLARSVNPVLYSLESFRARSHGGDPFVTDVLLKPRIMLRGSEDELRAVVSERLAD